MAAGCQEESLSPDIIQETHGKEVKPSFSTVTYTHTRMYRHTIHIQMVSAQLLPMTLGQSLK